MSRISTINILFFLLLSLSASTIQAQDKQFKNRWEGLIESMYITKSAYTNKTISGDATFQVFGFRDKQAVAADFIVNGHVESATGEKKKNWTVTLNNATADITGSNLEHITFDGSLKLTVVNDKDNKKVDVTLLFGPGHLSVNNRYLTLDDDATAWEQAQSIGITFDKEYKMKPSVTVYRNNLNLPDRKAFSQISPQVSSDIMGALKRYKVDDADFITSYFEPGTPVNTTTFPDYKEYRTVYYSAPGSDIVSHYDIDSIHFGRIVTPEYEINHFKDLTIINGPGIVANIENGKLKYANWGREHSYASFSGDTITRTDVTRLTGIKWDSSRYTKPSGAVTAMVKMMKQFTDSATYDFNGIYDECGLSASHYIDIFGNVEDIVDNNIPSLKRQAELLALEKTFIGPDRRLDNLRGHVRSMTLRSNATGASDLDYEYSYDGYYTRAPFGYINHDMPWSQATGTGDNYIERHPIECADLNDGNRIKKIYFDITITRNDDGTLASIEVPLPSYEANRGAFCDCYGTMTYTWKDGRPTHKAWTGHEYAGESRYSYDADANLSSVKDAESVEGYEIDGTTRYTYTRFDENGNWTERKVSYRGSSMFSDDEDSQDVTEDSWTEWRDINYYPIEGQNGRSNTTVTITTTISRPGQEPVTTVKSIEVK